MTIAAPIGSPMRAPMKAVCGRTTFPASEKSSSIRRGAAQRGAFLGNQSLDVYNAVSRLSLRPTHTSKALIRATSQATR